MQLLENKVALITGAGRGIGEAAAQLFAECGAKVVVVDKDSHQAEAIATAIQLHGGASIPVTADVTHLNDIEQIIARTLHAFGGIDILVNNAGYTWDGMFHKMSDDQWDAMLAVHLTASFRLIRAAAPYLRDAAKTEINAAGQARARKIINVSSTTGTRGKVGQANYAAAKAGILGLTRTLAKEWGAFNIQVNAVAFGMIDTRLTQAKDGTHITERQGAKIELGIPEAMRQNAYQNIPMGRAGSPHEAAGVLLFFASNLSNYVSGQVLEVTGGL